MVQMAYDHGRVHSVNYASEWQNVNLARRTSQEPGNEQPSAKDPNLSLYRSNLLAPKKLPK